MKRTGLFLLCMFIAGMSMAQDIQNASGYHRSTLYIVPVVHARDSFAAEIHYAAMSMPFPDRYNDMREGSAASVIQLDDKSNYKTLKDTTRHRTFDRLLDSNEIAKEMVKYWFNFDPARGFNTDRLVSEGMYDASELQKELARGTIEGVVNLADAGDELIKKTFVLVNDIGYINHAERAAYASAVCEVIAEVGRGTQDIGQSLSSTNTGLGIFDAAMGLVGAAVSLGGIAAELVGDLTKATNQLLDIRGFAVCEVTYLYQLEWTPEVQNIFYSKYYTETGDPAKIEAFLADKSTFRLTYVGTMPTTTNNSTAFNVTEYSQKSETEQILITCARTMDDAINTLQTRFPEFRVYTPVTDLVTDAKGRPAGVLAGIGLKEGVTLKKKYVLREMVIQNGKKQIK